jgi:hypothetical protein
MNLFRKSGVPLLPSQSAQPVGIVLVEPDHIVITPAGTVLSTPSANPDGLLVTSDHAGQRVVYDGSPVTSDQGCVCELGANVPGLLVTSDHAGQRVVYEGSPVTSDQGCECVLGVNVPGLLVTSDHVGQRVVYKGSPVTPDQGTLSA